MQNRLAERRAVGRLVRRQRLLRGLSQEQLGELVGVSQRYISKVEVGGVTMPRDDLLARLGDALGLTLPDFYAARKLLPAPQVALMPAPPPMGVRDDDDAAILIDLTNAVRRLAWHQTLDTLRAMRKLETREYYNQAVDALAAAWAANLRYHGEMLRIPIPPTDDDSDDSAGVE